ncbi:MULTISPECIES: DUF4097 family beta strand repeat-containing protein [unclassified Streptomyces]|uniref:DUF4097 family beta strand repeat-containing protein n=1 Tax=unclassified Streptomyces TaxID=2593676 RepID=UPI00225520A0|nr:MULTISPECIES: DUF4097 family beta strand repeat-containing protein [unclassified Streptomyces]MCX4529571.1 DUF4097 domain-containing protein [Streptomyces sp. NBC_01551]MCX4539856.1 DUF4097 domain-containing protein [Streptomyces sp. NBC_01565]
MPSYDTPEPITAIIEFEVGDVRITASKRTNTVVEVLPSNGAEETDVRAVQQTKVTYANGVLTVKGPKKRSLFGRHGSIDVTVELPAGSHLQCASPMGDYTGEGPLGDCRVKTSLGDIRLAEAGVANLRTDHGDIAIDRAVGTAEISGSGRIEIGTITGSATVKNGNGETTIGEITGDLSANSANGRIAVGTAHASVEAKSANGSIRVDEVARGVIRLQTAVGDLEIGIRQSTAAWLDVNSRFGTVRNALGAAEGPGASDETVEVHARTGAGNVVIRRA